MEPYADEIISDKLGTVAYVAKGTAQRPRVLLAGDIDEIGFVISGIVILISVSFVSLITFIGISRTLNA